MTKDDIDLYKVKLSLILTLSCRKIILQQKYVVDQKGKKNADLRKNLNVSFLNLRTLKKS
jgi:hypothetical protein